VAGKYDNTIRASLGIRGSLGTSLRDFSYRNSDLITVYDPATIYAGQLGQKAVQAGSAVPVTADGFAPRSAVTITLHSAARRLGTARADPLGRVRAQVTIPGTVESGAHVVTLDGTGKDGKPLHVRAQIRVIGGNHLPWYGKLPWSGWVVWVVLAGIVVVLLLRRALRRRR
jgi:hypothetical protein